MNSKSARRLITLILMSSLSVAYAAKKADHGRDTVRYQQWVQEMKDSERGPFKRIRWFCNDGSVFAPKPYACKDHDGGVQHGELTERVVEIRDAGYHIANLLAGVDGKEFITANNHRETLAQILIEQFLIDIDDGWILRQARYYRGAFQEEDERRGGRDLLQSLVGSDQHLQRDYALVRTAVRVLPHDVQNQSASKVRQLSADLSDRNKKFLTLRNKIHGSPEVSDAQRVREFASALNDAELAKDYITLADAIDALFSTSTSAALLAELAKRIAKSSTLYPLVSAAQTQLDNAKTTTSRMLAVSELLRKFRDSLLQIRSSKIRLLVLDLSLALESDLYALAAQHTDALGKANRGTRVQWLEAGVQAAYGTGLISQRQVNALTESAQSLSKSELNLAHYKRELDYLALLPVWSAQRVNFHFGSAITRFAELEPKSNRFVEDQLRGSPLFFYAKVLETLLRDANRLAGVHNELFGRDVGAGLRALNPGLSRGRLLAAPADGKFVADGIYVLPETTSDLPPVAGILTAGEGNPLSHVQLLARNLGIPNVGIEQSLLPSLTPLYGKTVILAVSAAGSVRLTEDTGEGAELFSKKARAEDQVVIRPNLQKLNLNERKLLKLSSLRADDSGRSVGPKAAKLGELKNQFPDTVAEGLAIPFGIFSAMLEQPYSGDSKSYSASKPSVFEWMTATYRKLEAMPKNSSARKQATEQFRRELYDWVLNADPGNEFRRSLRQQMTTVFGPDRSYGVFVRSDTNVEDLPEFTGAGLNLTVPNVVGVDAVIKALSRVWASPFTARAFAWRQAHMEGPEHVYPAILLLLSVNADKSGVMVTADIDTGNNKGLSVAINEGVGGAVDGQAAESLRINTETGAIRLLAQATAPWRRQVNLSGGVDKLPSSGVDEVLMRAEADQLIELAKVLPQRFPSIIDTHGQPAPADIEFGFLDGQLKLFQIRPFLESRQARGNSYLTSLDKSLKDLHSVQVTMSEAPQ